MSAKSTLAIRPLTPERWDDFVALFGPRGACGGCWCMTPRLSSAQFAKQKGARNERAMKALVERGPAPGLLAYRGKRAIGWCALGPRESYVRYARSRVAKPVDERPAWAIVCVYIDPSERGRGVSAALVRAAVEHARANGAELVEAFPVEPRAGQELVPVFAWTGIASTFTRAGFREVARRSPTRPYLRRELGAAGSSRSQAGRESELSMRASTRDARATSNTVRPSRDSTRVSRPKPSKPPRNRAPRA